MTAKDPRKALKIRLTPELRAALFVFASAHGDKSLSAALRRLVRAAAGVAKAPPHRCAADAENPARTRGRHRLRLQLEPELRRALTARLPQTSVSTRATLSSAILAVAQRELAHLGYLRAAPTAPGGVAGVAPAPAKSGKLLP